MYLLPLFSLCTFQTSRSLKRAYLSYHIVLSLSSLFLNFFKFFFSTVSLFHRLHLLLSLFSTAVVPFCDNLFILPHHLTSCQDFLQKKLNFLSNATHKEAPNPYGPALCAVFNPINFFCSFCDIPIYTKSYYSFIAEELYPTHH